MPIYDDFISILKSSPYGNDLYNYLYKQNKLPDVVTRELGDGSRGEYIPQLNQILLEPGATSPTMLHEATHAADSVLADQYRRRPQSYSIPDTPTYFTQGYEKLKGGVSNTNFDSKRQELARKLDRQWLEDNKDYRANHQELAGWAGGSTINNKDNFRPPNHLNSTLATEFSILMDLASRKDTPIGKSRSWIEKYLSK